MKRTEIGRTRSDRRGECHGVTAHALHDKSIALSSTAEVVKSAAVGTFPEGKNLLTKVARALLPPQPAVLPQFGIDPSPV